MAKNEKQAPLSSVLDDLRESGEEEGVSAGQILETFEHRSVGVLLTVFGLIAVLPVVGGIPGVSIVVATLVLIAVGQSLVGGGSLWMPDFVRRRRIGRDKFDRAIEKARPWVARVDRLLKPRLSALVSGRGPSTIAAIAEALLALAFYPLNFVPFAVTAPAVGVLAIGPGLLASDGLMVLIGYGMAGVTVYLLLTAV